MFGTKSPQAVVLSVLLIIMIALPVMAGPSVKAQDVVTVTFWQFFSDLAPFQRTVFVS